MSVIYQRMRQNEEYTPTVASLIKDLPENVFTDLNSDEETARTQAFQIIHAAISQLPDSSTITQELPLALAKQNNVVGAVGYILEASKNGQQYSPGILRQVLKIAHTVRRYHLRMRWAVDKDILSLKDKVRETVLKQLTIGNNPELFVIAGDYQTLFEDNLDEALSLYEQGMECWDPEAYNAAGEIWIKKMEMQHALACFTQAWELSGDPIYIGNIIYACRILDQKKEANEWYGLYKSKVNDPLPLIYFKKTIDIDTDLMEFTGVMRDRADELYLDTKTVRLSKAARRYVNERIETIKDELKDESTEPKDPETLWLRAFYYMEHSIFTLWDDTYIEEYVDALGHHLAEYSGECNDDDLGPQARYLKDNIPTVFKEDEVTPTHRIGWDLNVSYLDKVSIGMSQSLRTRMEFIAQSFHGQEHLGPLKALFAISQEYLPGDAVTRKLEKTISRIEYQGWRMQVIDDKCVIAYHGLAFGIEESHGTFTWRKFSREIRFPKATSKQSYEKVFKEDPILAVMFLVEKILCGASDAASCIVLFLDIATEVTDPDAANLLGECLIRLGYPSMGINYLCRVNWGLSDSRNLLLVVDGLLAIEHNQRKDEIENLDALSMDMYDLAFFDLIDEARAQAYANDHVYDQNLIDIAKWKLSFMDGDLIGANEHFQMAVRRVDERWIAEAAMLYEVEASPEDALEEYIQTMPLVESDVTQTIRVLLKILELSSKLGNKPVFEYYKSLADKIGLNVRHPRFSLYIDGSEDEQYKVVKEYFSQPFNLNDEDHEKLALYVHRSMHGDISTWDMRVIKRYFLASALQEKLWGEINPEGIWCHWENLFRIGWDIDENPEDLVPLCKLYEEFCPIKIESGEASKEYLHDLIHLHALNSKSIFLKGYAASNNKLPFIDGYLKMLSFVVVILREHYASRDHIDLWEEEINRMMIERYSITQETSAKRTLH